MAAIHVKEEEEGQHLRQVRGEERERGRNVREEGAGGGGMKEDKKRGIVREKKKGREI